MSQACAEQNTLFPVPIVTMADSELPSFGGNPDAADQYVGAQGGEVEFCVCPG